MGELILITGGARSGKSRRALELGGERPEPRTFIATAEGLDEEMAERIARHRRERGLAWRTVEEPVKVLEALEALNPVTGVAVLDCIGLWISNLLRDAPEERAAIEATVGRLVAGMDRLGFPLIAVTNEVGMGIVPMEALSRRFGDCLGFANQCLAHRADTVLLMVAGVPLRLK